jgi:ATP-dependent DNA helicase RecG
MTLGTPIAQVRGISEVTAQGLRELGVRNVGQLVAYVPFKHERREAETTISELEPDRLVAVRGTVSATRVVRVRPRPRFEAVLIDETGRLDLVWFNGLYLASTIHPGDRLLVQGKTKKRAHLLQIANPKYERLAPDPKHTGAGGPEPDALDEAVRPVYPASERLPSRRIELAVAKVLDAALPLIADHLPGEYRQAREMPELAEAYRWLHKPETLEQAAAGRRRLAYDELLLLQLALAMKRHERRAHAAAPALPSSAAIDQRIRARIPFTLTKDQDEVVAELVKDLGQTVPAHRLIQGDVGSGKTVVALYAMLLAVAHKHQAALMAPTELLAQQHYAGISRMLEGSRVRVALLSGSLSGGERQSVLERLRTGEIDLVVGTHALVTGGGGGGGAGGGGVGGGGVEFRSLAVAVVDEQHRFGVHQRAALREKGVGGGGGGGGAGGEGGAGRVPHVIVMTATPIPRTLAMTLMGDLEVSTIRGMPPGRKPVKTRVVEPERAAEVYGWVRKRLHAGERAYVVAPTIGGEDEGGSVVMGVEQLRERLEAGPLAGFRLGVLHGRVPLEERESVMRRFRAGEVQCLVATTVIEVGVDVPEASVMVIEQAERFGLAQLHQLRGRVGRGSTGGVCVAIARATTDDAAARLGAFAASTDGFALAEKDLEIRGFGDMAGARQAGAPDFRSVELPRDMDLLVMARRDAREWIERSPTLSGPGEQLLRRRLLKAHGAGLGLAGTG